MTRECSAVDLSVSGHIDVVRVESGSRLERVYRIHMPRGSRAKVLVALQCKQRRAPRRGDVYDCYETSKFLLRRGCIDCAATSWRHLRASKRRGQTTSCPSLIELRVHYCSREWLGQFGCCCRARSERHAIRTPPKTIVTKLSSTASTSALRVGVQCPMGSQYSMKTQTTFFYTTVSTL